MATPSSNHAPEPPPILPIDVLCEIFKSYIEGYYHTRLSLMRRRRDIPWFLSHVCHQWRIAAIATPQLWKRFPPFELTGQDDLLADDPMFGELFKRSGAHPICVQFDFSSIEVCTSMESDLLNHINTTSSRWETVTIRCPLVRTIGSHFRDVEGRVPRLRRVELLLLDGNLGRGLGVYRVGKKSPVNLVNIFCKTPTLSELLLQIRPSVFTSLAVPWEQLTKLQWDNSGGIYDALKYAKNLDTFMAVGCENLARSTRPCLEHSKLRRFHFHIRENHHFWDLLCKLKLPALEVLAITQDPNWPGPYWDIAYVLTSLFVRSKCDLKHLALNAGELTETYLLNILDITPNLETLEISADSSRFDGILLKLVFGGTEEAFLPYLHTLILVFPSNITTRQAAMIQCIVESRNQVVVGEEDSPGLLFSPLQNVCVRVQPDTLRFQLCLDLNGEDVDTTYPVDFFNTLRFQHLRAFMTRRDFQWGPTTLNERQIADVFRCGLPSCKAEDRSLRKACRSLMTADFIKSLKWMLVGKEDIVYIHSEHELRNSPNCLDIAFGTPYGRLEL